jgi:hypothetical protein
MSDGRLKNTNHATSNMVFDSFLDSGSIASCFPVTNMAKRDERYRNFTGLLVWPPHNTCVLYKRMAKKVTF